MLNTDKCVFKVTSLNFLGHELSSNGIRPAADKIKSLRDFRPPQTSEEVRSFLGLVNYVGKFLPDLATKTFFLRELTKNDKKFEWTKECDQAFINIKELLTNVETLGYYNPLDRTRVIADASPVGRFGRSVNSI